MKLIKDNILIILGILIIIALTILCNFNEKTYTITITDKDRITQKSGDTVTSKYLVFGDDEDGNSLVFENTDTLLRFKFNSSNIQGRLKTGKTYDVTVVGFRIPIFSAYENIIDCYEITD